ncbi:hypothetical protein PR048_019168 [Dryococelus australis]|uniref:Uncharacterized protein n=1 Tax=Dryococelus australis TaxID=614101 RepID=A0ABQ9H2U8_9NEOP|nr:hypothetical protein PR048_019168 [Dryococelus australis]
MHLKKSPCSAQLYVTYSGEMNNPEDTNSTLRSRTKVGSLRMILRHGMTLGDWDGELRRQRVPCTNQLLGVRGSGSGGVVARALASHHGVPGLIPSGFIPGISHVGIVLDDAACQRVFSGYSISLRPCIPEPLHPSVSFHVKSGDDRHLRVPAGKPMFDGVEMECSSMETVLKMDGAVHYPLPTARALLKVWVTLMLLRDCNLPKRCHSTRLRQGEGTVFSVCSREGALQVYQHKIVRSGEGADHAVGPSRLIHRYVEVLGSMAGGSTKLPTRLALVRSASVHLVTNVRCR